MDDLIARLEAATEGSRELDAQIFFALQPEYHGTAVSKPAYGVFLRGYGSDGDLPHYTTSIDAAVTLIEGGNLWHVCKRERSPCYLAAVLQPHEGFSKASTPALALCIAALKARQTDE